jgi:hypothetical protein
MRHRCECGHCRSCYARTYYLKHKERNAGKNAERLRVKRAEYKARKAAAGPLRRSRGDQYETPEWIECHLAMIDRLNRRTRWQEITRLPAGTSSGRSLAIPPAGADEGENPSSVAS